MKKLLAALFFILMMSGAAFADELSYEIDPVATAKAPWKVGEKTIEKGNFDRQDYYREFLGVTQSGLALVQHFYLSGEKFSDPFLMTVTDAGNNMEGSLEKGNGIEGHYIQWYKNGQKMGEATIKNGNPEGMMIRWYWNGQKEEEKNYKNGKREGSVTAWYENGQKRAEGNFKNNMIDGLYTIWYENGQKREVGHWKDGAFDGLVTNWYENGQKHHECNLKGKQPFGVCRIWDMQGNLIKEKDFGTPKD